MEKFIPNRLAFITLISACIIILVSMGLRQTFGLFFSAFEQDLNTTRTEFGLAVGIQMLFWGFFAPLFGIGYSWGGFESLAVYQDIQREFKKYKDKDLHIVRLHIGLEDPKDLILDIKNSLKYIK